MLNKIDLPGAEPSRVAQEIEEVGVQKAGSFNGCVVHVGPLLFFRCRRYCQS